MSARKQSDKTAKALTLPQGQKDIATEGKDSKSRERIMADAALSPSMANACTVSTFAQGAFGALSFPDVLAAMMGKVSRVNAGDLTSVEATLTAQASALDSIFNEMARRAALNMGEHLGATETYLRLAFKAQAQCRGTLQTLAEIKNPRPVAFVKAQQANISQGHQQVNNGGPPAHAREEISNQSNELLGAGNGERLDSGKTGTPGREYSHVEAIG